MNQILFSFLVSIGINLVMFVPAFIFKTDKITDISYAVTFAVVAIASYMQSAESVLHKIVLVLVLMWSVRLGTFLFIRINKIGHDSRFDGIREKFFLFLRFWVLQGATVFVVMLAPIFVFAQKDTHLSLLSIFGIVIFIKGLIIEAIADAQKFRFNNDVRNKGKWIDVGIWRASRHPNYLGEMMVWTGMYITVVNSLSSRGTFVALLSPLYIIGLLLFVSGVPLLEKSANKKWGKEKSFVSYKSQVPTLLPSISSIRRAFNHR
jgi:steroid 5-alpha reductase family enzyme